jgi:hypothetical protein
MKEHGIYTSQADIWLHFFPLKPAIYWYPVSLMCLHLRRAAVTSQFAQSKNGEITGFGCVVPQTEWFVRELKLRKERIERVPWNWGALNDRDFGLRGQEFVYDLLARNELMLGLPLVRSVTTREGQFDGVDIELDWHPTTRVEIKTERPLTGNLFVQTREGGHRVDLVRTSNGTTVSRPSLADWEDPF